jgi:hypothetical protein
MAGVARYCGALLLSFSAALFRRRWNAELLANVRFSVIGR